MVQREVADRFFASPRTKAYGAVSVLLQLASERTGFHPVSREVFRPRPNVDSALVAFRRTRPGIDPRVKRLVEASFAHRRKTLANSLALSDQGDDHPRPRDPDVHRGGVRHHVLPGVLDQQLHAACAHPGHRHRGGRCDHRAGERVPTPGGAGRKPGGRGHERHPRDRLRGAVDDGRAGGGVHAARIPERIHRPAVQRVRHRRRGVGDHLGLRGAHTHADALRQDPPGAASATACCTARSRTGSPGWRPATPGPRGALRHRLAVVVARCGHRAAPSWCSARSSASSCRPRTRGGSSTS